MARIVLGFAPTRRSIFSAPDAVKYADLTRARLRELGVEFVDIDDIAEDGLLHDDGDRIKIAEKFREAKVDGLFFPPRKFRDRVRGGETGEGSECAGASVGAER